MPSRSDRRRRHPSPRRLTGAAAVGLSVCVALPVSAQQRSSEPPAPDPLVFTQDASARGWVGITLSNAHLICDWEDSQRWKPCRLNLEISDVSPGSPAHQAGLRSGDRLVAVNGTSLQPRDWAMKLSALRVGTPVSFDYEREGQTRYVQLTPARRPPGFAAPAMSMSDERLPTTYVWAPQSGEDTAVRLAFTMRRSEGQLRAVPSALRFEGDTVRIAPLEGSPEVVRVLSAEAPRLREEISQLSRLRDVTYRQASDLLNTWIGTTRQRVRTGSGEPGSVRVTLSAPRVALVSRRLAAGAEFHPLDGALARTAGGTDAGLLVIRVVPDTPADRLGLQPDDFVIQVAGEACADVDQLRYLLTRQGGQPVEVVWVRDGRRMSGRLR